MRESAPSISTNPSERKMDRLATGAALLAALFAAPEDAFAQSHRHGSEHHHGASRHRSHGGDLRREARRVVWTAEDQELFTFLEETIPYDRNQTGNPIQMAPTQMDEFAALLRKRTLYLLQQGQSERDQPGLLTTSLAAHDNEDGTVRQSSTFDGSLSHMSVEELTNAIRIIGHRQVSGHYTSVYYEVARDRAQRDYWEQVGILESSSDSRRAQFDTSGDEMDQFSYNLTSVPDPRTIERDYRSRPTSSEGRGRTPAEAVSNALWKMMFRPANQGTGRYGSDNERVFHFHLYNWNASLINLTITQPFQRIGPEWSVSLEGILLEPRERH